MAKKKVLITLPKGAARYPWLNTADSKFGDPRYKCDIISEAGMSGDIMAVISDALDEHFDKVVEEKTGKYNEIFKDELPYFEEDGQVTFRTSLNKNGKSKRTGETWENKITFYGANGKPLPEGKCPKIGGGSVLRISCELNDWDVPETEGRGKDKVTNLKVGMSLRIKGVQVIEPRQDAAGPASAESMGFEEEEGYSYDPDSFEEVDDGSPDDF